MMISALSLLSFLLATQLIAAASTDEEIIWARLGVLSRYQSPNCYSNYRYCNGTYSSKHQGQQIDFCQAITESKACSLKKNTYDGTTFGPCTESEYEKVKEVGCMCKEALDAFRNLDSFTSSVSDDCKNKAETCISQEGATINDYCNVIREKKQCLTSGSNSCSEETYDKVEAIVCHVECGGIKVAQYSIFLMIITSFLKFL